MSFHRNLYLIYSMTNYLLSAEIMGAKMGKFDRAIYKIEEIVNDVPLSYFFVGIPSVGTGLSLNNGAGWDAFYFFAAGCLIMIIHAFFIYKLVSAELEEPHRYSWLIRLIFVGIYFFAIPILFIYFSYSISLESYGGIVPL